MSVILPVLWTPACFGPHQVVGRVGQRQLQGGTDLGHDTVLTTVDGIDRQSLGRRSVHAQVDQRRGIVRADDTTEGNIGDHQPRSHRLADLGHPHQVPLGRASLR